jgi:sulfide dehydrogenase cytochrome subunit
MKKTDKHMLQTIYRTAAVLAFALAGLTTVQAGQTPRAQLLAQNCAACHGVNGREFNESMPPLAGMQTEQFIRAMKAFKDGERPAIIMDRVARGYDQAEIEAMAKFFAEQPATEYGTEERP